MESGFFASSHTCFDIVEARYQIGDRIYDIVRATLVHGRVNPVAVLLLHRFGHVVPLAELHADLVA